MLTKSKPPAINWKRAKTIAIPIPPSGTTWRKYPDMPPEPCDVTASFKYLPVAGKRWAYRFHVDSPLLGHDDPDCEKRIALASEGLAIQAAVDMILRILREEVEFRRRNKQTEVASACAQAVWHVEQFAKYFQETGKFRCVPVEPGGNKPREEFDAEVEAVQRQAPLISFDPKTKAAKPKPATALVPAAVIDVASTPAEKLSTDERRDLKQLEKQIERGARAWVEMAEGLVEICDRRLWRETHPTFDAWVESRRIDRSMAYGLMKATRIRRQLQMLKSLPAIELDRESQYRPFPADATPQDLAAVMKRVVRKVDPDADGVRRPTAQTIRQAVREETTSPDDLKREQQRAKERAEETARLRAAHQRQGIAVDPPAESGAEYSVPSTQPAIADPIAFIDPQTRPIDHIYVIRLAIKKVLALHMGAGEADFRREFRAMLYEEWNAITPPAAARRAK